MTERPNPARLSRPDAAIRRTILTACFAALAALLVGALSVADALAQSIDPEAKAAAEFMRTVMDKVNPSISVEDSYCASALPWAIYSTATANDLDWRQVFALAWQESRFDCHAKNRHDHGGAYGPFQIRRVWESVVGDPRYRYYDPELAVDRVVRILRYYQETDRFADLHKRGFRFPLLCLYNAGEAHQVSMEYCKTVGKKMDVVKRGWQDFKDGKLVALTTN
jgi:hypothetical protein